MDIIEKYENVIQSHKEINRLNTELIELKDKHIKSLENDIATYKNIIELYEKKDIITKDMSNRIMALINLGLTPSTIKHLQEKL